MTRIGVFDSGLGGLTVLREMIGLDASYYYFGDNLRVPYGNRSKEEIISFSDQIVAYLEGFGIDEYFIACNTISAVAYDFLIDKYKKPFHSILDIGAQKALEEEGDYLVLGTRATINSHLYKERIEEKNNADVYEVVAENLVDYVEKGITDGDELDDQLARYLRIANEKEIPNIILGCTHYPIIEDRIRANLNYPANIINPASGIMDGYDDLKPTDKPEIKIIMSKKNPVTEKLIAKLIKKDYQLSYKELN